MNATAQLNLDELTNLEREVAEGRATPAAQRRLERLKHKHEKEWLGPVAKALHSHEFRDGTLHKAVLRDGKHLAECARDPRWATVEVLELGRNTEKYLGMSVSDFLAAMPLLHTLSLHAEQLPERAFPYITTLEVDGVAPISLLAERFPGLDTLEVSFLHRPEDLWAHPLAAQLESFTLGSLTWKGDVVVYRPRRAIAYAEWIAKGPPLRRLEIEEDCVFGTDGAGDLQEVFDAARLRGADVVLLPEPQPRSEWTPWRRRDRYDRWH